MELHRKFSLIVCLCLLTGTALAQDVVEPDREHRRGMSYEEYSSIREQMRVRMENTQSNKQKQQKSDDDQTSSAEGSYGRDYQSRNQVDRPDVKFERPERPQINRPERPEVFRR